jgi:hypothetical protein
MFPECMGTRLCFYLNVQPKTRRPPRNRFDRCPMIYNQPRVKNLSETRFEWLLNQRGCSFVDEDNLDKKIAVKSKKPDYFVWRDEISVLAEVKEFAAAGPLHNSDRSGAVAVNDIMDRFRRPLVEAAKQLKPYKELGFPNNRRL